MNAFSPSLRKAAERLREALQLDPTQGSVGVGADELIVLVWQPWAGARPATFEGLAVRWHDGIGEPQAQACGVNIAE